MNHLFSHIRGYRENIRDETLHDLYRSGRATMRYENGKLRYTGTQAEKIYAGDKTDDR